MTQEIYNGMPGTCCRRMCEVAGFDSAAYPVLLTSILKTRLIDGKFNHHLRRNTYKIVLPCILGKYEVYKGEKSIGVSDDCGVFTMPDTKEIFDDEKEILLRFVYTNIEKLVDDLLFMAKSYGQCIADVGLKEPFTHVVINIRELYKTLIFHRY
jgi:hypothetical protein